MTFNEVTTAVFEDPKPTPKVGKYVILITPLNGDRSFTYRDPKTNKVVSFTNYTEAVIFGHDLCEHRAWAFDVNYRSPR